MRTQGVTKLQLTTMVVFAFSCFGLLLFLWLSFGGPIPLQPQGYRVKIDFPEATTLAKEADVRVSGVNVGNVKTIERAPEGNRTRANIEIESRFAPLHVDDKAILRQKTLLGETYVEITLGTRSSKTIPEDGRLANSRVADSVQLDEVLKLFPKRTVADFRRWQDNTAASIKGRGDDLNASLGNIAGFATGGEDLLTTLGRRRETLGQLVAQTGSVFEAITRDENQLRAFISDTAQWLEATASQRDALAESIQVFPTFLRESRRTLARIETFSHDTKPLVDDLGPVLRDLQPTLADLRKASPDLQRAFNSLPAVIRASKDGLPALSRVLRGLVPVLDATTPFLAQLNPILSWLQLNQGTVANFISTPGAALANTESTTNPNANGHILPQVIMLGSQSAPATTRTPDNRGNTYPPPDVFANLDPYRNGYNTAPAWDCNNTGGEHKAQQGNPGCLVAPPIPFQGQNKRFPRVLESTFDGARERNP